MALPLQSISPGQRVTTDHPGGPQTRLAQVSIRATPFRNESAWADRTRGYETRGTTAGCFVAAHRAGRTHAEGAERAEGRERTARRNS